MPLQGSMDFTTQEKARSLDTEHFLTQTLCLSSRQEGPPHSILSVLGSRGWSPKSPVQIQLIHLFNKDLLNRDCMSLAGDTLVNKAGLFSHLLEFMAHQQELEDAVDPRAVGILLHSLFLYLICSSAPVSKPGLGSELANRLFCPCKCG